MFWYTRIATWMYTCPQWWGYNQSRWWQYRMHRSWYHFMMPLLISLFVYMYHSFHYYHIFSITMCPPFIHYLTPSAPIETDEVTLHSVLLLGLWMCRECFQGVLLFSLLHDVSEWRVLAKYQRFIANRNEPESSSVHQEWLLCTTVPKGTTCNPLSVDWMSRVMFAGAA